MDYRLRDPHHLEIARRETARRYRGDASSFDRIAFARRVLRVVQPNNWTFALYEREGEFHADRVRDLRRGANAVWATVGIPTFASREEIAYVLAQLTGKQDAPYLLNVLATSDERVG